VRIIEPPNETNGDATKPLTETLRLHRFHEHSLGAAKGPDRPKPALTDAVVNSSAGNAEKLGSLVDGDAATELRLKLLVWLI
jgi:hypothetical protein